MEQSSLVGGWATPQKNMKVNWDDYSQHMGKSKMATKSPTRSINARFSIGEISNQKRPTLERESVDHHVKWCVAVTDWIHFKKWGNSGGGYNPCISYRSITALGVHSEHFPTRPQIQYCWLQYTSQHIPFISHESPIVSPFYPKLKPILQRVQDMVLFSRKFSTKLKSC